MTAVRCTCSIGLAAAGHPLPLLTARTSVDDCPQHGQRTPQAATGTRTEGEARGVPVVDITATIQGLYQHAEECRERAASADLLALSFRREADYLESLASHLDGAVGGPRD